MMMTDSLKMLRSLPDAKENNPGFDLNAVKGNTPKEELALGINAFSYFVWHPDGYAPELGRRIVPVEWNVWKRDGRLEAETVCEIVVTKGATQDVPLGGIEHRLIHRIDMCNIFKGLSGTSAAYLLDM